MYINIELVHGVYKPTYILFWGHHLVYHLDPLAFEVKNIPAEGKPRERFDWLLPGESQSPVIYNIKCSSDQFG